MSPQQPSPSPAVLPAHPAPETTQRQAQQLHTLSQVVETLTYRLLELEERLAAQDQRLQEFAEQEPPGMAISAAEHGRLDDTEERLQRIESLLTGEPIVSTRPAGVEGGQDDVHDHHVHDIDGPFPEEPEQPFLDELEAAA